MRLHRRSLRNRSAAAAAAILRAYPAAHEVGAELGETRRALGRSLADAQSELRIRGAFLQAIEEGRLGDLPGPAYVAGFVRSYGDYLGLDGADAVRRLKAPSASSEDWIEISPPPTPIPDGRAPTRGILLAAAALAVAVYGLWYFTEAPDAEPAAAVGPLPERFAALIADPADPAEPAAEAGAGAGTLPEPREAAAPAGAAPEPVAAAVWAAPRVVLRARADAWLEIRPEAGAPLYSGILRQGAEYPVPNRPGLALTTGDAGGIDVLVDGEAAPGLGPRGAVLRGLALDPDRLPAR